MVAKVGVVCMCVCLCRVVWGRGGRLFVVRASRRVSGGYGGGVAG